MSRVGPVGAVLVGLLALLAPPASAQRAYVANSAAGTVSVLDTASGASLGTIAVGGGPAAVAITPDGRRAYIANAAADTVAVIDTATNTTIATIAVGDRPEAIAIAPDGTSAWVANAGDDTVAVIDLATNALRGAPIAVGPEPEGIAIAPDGTRALVTQRGGGVSVLATATGALVGSLPSALGPGALAITPEGTRAYLANESSNSVSIFSLLHGTPLGAPIPVGNEPAAVAIAPNGPVLATSPAENTLSLVDPLTHTRIGPPLAGFAGPSGVAASADGTRAYVANAAAQSVAVVDTQSAQVVGELAVGSSPQGIALAPAQPPRAALTATRAPKQGQLFGFDASASADPDSPIATYSWDFGDGQGESGPAATVEHRYARPGSYLVSVVAVDAQGCSTAFVFTGQTASCNGSAVARATARVTATDTTRPAFRLRGAPRQPLRRKAILSLACPQERCAVRLGAVLRVAAKGARSSHRLAPRRVSVPQGGRVKAALTLPAKALAAARRALREGGGARIAVVAVARDGAGNESRRKLAVRFVTRRMTQ